MSVEIRSLEKWFGAYHAVKDTSVSIQDGEFFVMLGPSGCGKTTTLRMVAGLELPTSGEIRIRGRDVTYMEPRHRDIAMAFQDYGLYPHLSIRWNRTSLSRSRCARCQSPNVAERSKKLRR